MKFISATIILSAFSTLALAGVADTNAANGLFRRQGNFCNSGNCGACDTSQNIKQCCVQDDGQPTAGRCSICPC